MIMISPPTKCRWDIEIVGDLNVAIEIIAASFG
jgi:hypothetical protein